MNKKLISINLAIILIITLFANIVFATSGEDGSAVPGGISRPNADGTTVAPDVVDYIKIDGVIYEIGEEKSGDGWRLDEYGMLYLSGYVGGSIYANYDLAIWTLLDDNRVPNTTISAETDEYGIYVDGDLYINNYSDNMVINGGTNKEAIYVNGDLHLTYNIVAVSSSCQALYANSVTIDSYAMIYGGENDSSLTGGKYIGEKYIKTVPIIYGFEHDVILDGNGILTTDGKEQHKIHLTVTTPTSLKLNTYKPKFNNKGQKLLGWVNENNEFVDNDILKIKPYKDTETVYAYWENDTNKVLILQNYFGNNKAFKKPVRVGDKFTLPSISKEGYVFEGWHGDGILYNAGTEITVKDTCYFWPQFTNDNDDHEKQKWLTIGNTGMSVRGDITHDPQWKYYDDVDGGTLVLDGYDGGSIEANFDLNIELRYDTPSKIVAEYGGYGIYVDGDLSFSTYVNMDGSKQGELEIQSQNGFEAIYATGDLELCSGITAIGNDCSAIKSNAISIPDDTTVFAGNNKNDAVISEYNSQQYVNIARKHYDFTVTLDANGGAKENGETEHIVKLYTSTPATLELYDYDNLYKNGDKRLIGWKTSDESFCKYNKYRFNAYDFDETLYAVWEDDVTKAVYLNNYYMDYNFEEHAEMSGGTVVETVASGNFFELPPLSRTGYVFDGWLMSDGTLKKAGEKIQITETTTLTAKYSINPDVIIINGREYPSNKRSGSYSSGWRFYPDAECAELEILHNYSGKPVVIPQNVNIHLEHDIKGDKELPALTVYGNANITTDYRVQISGQNGNPAIKVTGNLSFGEVASYGNLTYIIDTKPNNTPAINANKLTIYNNLIAAGPDLNSLAIADSYNNEAALKICSIPSYAIKATKGDIVPNSPNILEDVFYGWRASSDLSYNTIKWYMPGDVVDFDKDIVLYPCHLNKNRTSIAIALNGNGGVTSNNSKYIITLASASNLMPYDIPYEQFYREGYTFTGFNTDAAGNGTPYLYNSIIDDGHSYVYNLYAQWKKNETPAPPSNPSPSGGGGGGAPSENKADIYIGDTKVTATVSGTTVTISKFEPSSPTKSEISIDISGTGKSVDTAKLASAIIKEIAKSEGVEIKLSDGNVSFDAIALETISRELGNNQLSLKIGKATEKSMNSSQKAAAKELNTATFYEFTLKAGSKVISNFNGGKAEVEINVGKGRKGQIKMHHISDKGKITDIDATYDKNTGMAKATLGHFSLYAITFDESVVIEETPVFSDVNKEDWYYDSVISASKLGLMKGVSDTTFAPDDKVTRAMFTTVLHRLSGDTKDTQDISFSDVATDSYYANAVSWAKRNGIVNGVTETEFAPNQEITREQMATMIFRYAIFKEQGPTETWAIKMPYNDLSDISEYATDAVMWCYLKEIMKGNTDGNFLPLENANRAELAAVFVRVADIIK